MEILRRSIFWAEGRRGWRSLWVAVLLLAASAWALARQGAGKGFYYGGAGYEFYTDYNRLGIAAYDLTNDPPNRLYATSIPVDSFVGSLGAVAYNNLLYCFFETASTGLRYAAFDPQTRSWQPLGTLSTAAYGSGLCAAVCGDAIYIFGSNGYRTICFRSTDGKNFTTWPIGLESSSARYMMDAATFYPPGDDPAGILFVFKDGQGALKSCIYYPSNGTTTLSSTLPQSPDPLHTWQPVIMGNLLLGTSSCNAWGYHLNGATAPCVEFYGLTDKGGDKRHHGGRWEFNLQTGNWTLTDITQVLAYDTVFLDAIPFFTVLDATTSAMQQSHVIKWMDSTSLQGFRTFKSDLMIPQHRDPTWGWRGLPTATSTATGDTEEEKQLRSMWQLHGFVLGPPPFAINATPDEDVRYLSFVAYGKDLSQSVTTTSTWSNTLSIASEFKVKAVGQAKFDLSYARGWTGSNGTTTAKTLSTVYSFGPEQESPSYFGTHGWAIFSAPVFITQWYKLYAYDYDAQGHGTYLNQDIYATSVGNSVLQVQNFSLTDPSDGSMPNLFDGLKPFPDSTDLAGWKNMTDWNRCTDWSVIFGDGSKPPVSTLNLGVKSTVTYGDSTTTFGSTGNTNSFSVQAGGGIALNGYSEMVTAGADIQWGNTTDSSTTETQTVTSELNMPIPPPTSPDYVKSLIVQPYWLMATTNKAPWVPSGYPGNLPWCLTWRVILAKTNDGRVIGTLGSPESASATVRHGGDSDMDTYKLDGGPLTWVDLEGAQTPLPLTADDFDPSMGASVSLNGFDFQADGTGGKWTRKGDIWKYKTREGVKGNPFSLELDFREGAWSFEGLAKRLDDAIKAADSAVHVAIGINGDYELSLWLEHDIEAKWSHREKKSAWEASGVHEVSGAYNSRTNVGHLALKGHIPKGESMFGDTEIKVNGKGVSFPLLAAENFLEKLDRGGKVGYKSDGLFFEIDFGTGRWSARIEGGWFESGMAPRDGDIRLEVLIGGHTISDQAISVSRHNTALAYKRR